MSPLTVLHVCTPGTHQGFVSSYLKSWHCSFCSNLVTNNSIWSQFCTCHDNQAVMTCAKLWPDLISIFYAWAMCIYKRLALWAHKPFMKSILDISLHRCKSGTLRQTWSGCKCKHNIYRCTTTANTGADNMGFAPVPHEALLVVHKFKCRLWPH